MRNVLSKSSGAGARFLVDRQAANGLWAGAYKEQDPRLATSFALTMLIPLQYAVLAGVGLSMVLHVVRQSNQVTIKRQHLDPDGHLIEISEARS